MPTLMLIGLVRALTHQGLQRVLDRPSLDARQVQSPEHHFHDRIAPYQRVPQLLPGLELRGLGDGLDVDVLQSDRGELLADGSGGRIELDL